MAGFIKLDSGILDSTVWVDLPARNVFLTALLMAEPYELAEPTAQLQVDALESTGWTVPAGWYGIVRAAGPGIVRRSLVAADDGLTALRRLGEPDPESRSREFEGRRLARIDGGYLVLNYMRFRERDYTAAKRAKRYRQRRDGRVTRGDRDVTRNITQADAEAEAYTPTTTDHQYPEAFEHVWAVYPKRAGGNSKADASKAWTARVRDGATPDEILAGTERYRRFCEATGKLGTEYVKQARTFFGPGQHFRDPWTLDGRPGPLDAYLKPEDLTP